MPLFDFRCVDCKTSFESIVPADTATAKCPKCGAPSRKQLSAPSGFNLKGDGFYKPTRSSSSDND